MSQASLRGQRIGAVLVVAVALSSAACGGGGSKDASEPTTPPDVVTTPPERPEVPAPPARELVLGLRGIDPTAEKQPEFGLAAKAGKDSPVQLRVMAPPSGQERLVVTLQRSGTKSFSVRSSVGDKSETGRITLPREGQGINRLTYSCSLPPATYCPVRATGTRSSVRLSLEPSDVPLVATLDFGRRDDAAPVRLIPLGAPAPGSPVQAAVTLTEIPADSEAERKRPAATAEVAPGSRARVYVVPAPGSPEKGSLRIAITRTSGKAIEIRAGGSPASVAMLTGAKGRTIRLGGLRYSCGFGATTFCPLKISRTSTGLDIRLPTPQVPVDLFFDVASG